MRSRPPRRSAAALTPHAAQPILTTLVGQGLLAAGGRVIEVQAVEFVLAGWGDRNIAVGPAIRCTENFLQNDPRLSIDVPISPSLISDFTCIARVEYKRALQGQPVTTVSPRLATKGATLERVNALEHRHQLEPRAFPVQVLGPSCLIFYQIWYDPGMHSRRNVFSPVLVALSRCRLGLGPSIFVVETTL